MHKKDYGVVLAETLKSRDGVGFLKAIIAGELPQSPMAELLGFRLVEVDQGRAMHSTLLAGDAYTHA